MAKKPAVTAAVQQPAEPKTVTVAVWQGPAVPAVVADNLATLERVVLEEASKRGAKLVVFPELFLCGYDCSEAQLRAGAALSPSSDTLTKVAAAACEAAVAVAVGYAELAPAPQPGAPEVLYNAIAIFNADGTLAANYRKVNLRGAWEQATFSGGGPDQLAPVKLTLGDGVAPLHVGAALAYDLEFPEVGRALAVQGARLLLAPGALGTGPLEMATPFRTLPTRALENAAFVAFANLEGPAKGPPQQGVESFAGHSAILGASGEDIVRAGGVTGGQLLTAPLLLSTDDSDSGNGSSAPSYLAARAARLAEGHYAVLSGAPSGGSRGRSRKKDKKAQEAEVGRANLAGLPDTGIPTAPLPCMYSVPNPSTDTAASGTGKRGREDGDGEKAGSRRGRRVLCIKCHRPSRSVCSACGASVCSSSVQRPCFSQHVADHCLAAGWAMPPMHPIGATAISAATVAAIAASLQQTASTVVAAAEGTQLSDATAVAPAEGAQLPDATAAQPKPPSV